MGASGEMPADIHTFAHSFLGSVETFVCVRHRAGHRVLRRTEQAWCCPSGALGTGARLDHDRPGLVLAESSWDLMSLVFS